MLRLPCVVIQISKISFLVPKLKNRIKNEDLIFLHGQVVSSEHMLDFHFSHFSILYFFEKKNKTK